MGARRGQWCAHAVVRGQQQVVGALADFGRHLQLDGEVVDDLRCQLSQLSYLSDCCSVAIVVALQGICAVTSLASNRRFSTILDHKR